MTSSVDLQFDKMRVDTKLAKEYMKKNNFEFHCVGFKDTGQSLCDKANNKIHLSDFFIPTCEWTTGEVRDEKHYVKLYTLARNIDDNVDLFCQLEYLIRGKSIKTTQIELKMIIKYLQYRAGVNTRSFTNYKQFGIDNDGCLMDLGLVAAWAPAAVIFAAENTAVVCHLFTELCREAGLNSVNLCFTKTGSVEFEACHITKNKVLEGGCIGVVTTQSDVDSAVDVFLSAPKGDLWGLRRILVQESTYERFKKEFAWKTRSGSLANDDGELASLCTDVYVYEDKVFVSEYVGGADGRDVVPIESFRTAKELLALVEGYRPFCVSLWAHGLAESAEIAFGLTAPLVWVNRYGTVGKPTRFSLAYYSQINLYQYGTQVPEMIGLQKLQRDWIKLKVHERSRKMLESVNSLPASDERTIYMRSITSNEDSSDDLVHVGRSDMVVGISKPRDVYAIDMSIDPSSAHAAEVIRCLLGGSGFIIRARSDDKFTKLVTALTRDGLPVVTTESTFESDTFPLPQCTRIIHTSYGTIFAN